MSPYSYHVPSLKKFHRQLGIILFHLQDARDHKMSREALRNKTWKDHGVANCLDEALSGLEKAGMIRTILDLKKGGIIRTIFQLTEECARRLKETPAP
jgi:hypothetical protein